MVVVIIGIVYYGLNSIYIYGEQQHTAQDDWKVSTGIFAQLHQL